VIHDLGHGHLSKSSCVFINEMLAMGEEGFVMATLETALEFLDSFELDREKR